MNIYGHLEELERQIRDMDKRLIAAEKVVDAAKSSVGFLKDLPGSFENSARENLLEMIAAYDQQIKG